MAPFWSLANPSAESTRLVCDNTYAALFQTVVSLRRGSYVDSKHIIMTDLSKSEESRARGWPTASTGSPLPYSLDEEINTLTYKTLDKPGYWGVHAVSEVWAQMLWIMLQKLLKKHGYSDDLFPPTPDASGNVPTGDFYRKDKKGLLVPKHSDNTLIVQLVFNAMKLQACRPSFFHARDAIIQADQVLTGGEDFCVLWEGFDACGLGPDAKVVNRTPRGGGIYTNGHSVPAACEDY